MTRIVSLALVLFASAPVHAQPLPTATVVDMAAQEQWKRRCLNCHGADGAGPGYKRENVHIPDFRAAAWQKKHDDAFIRDSIRDGIRERHMPAFKNKLTAEQIDALVALIRTFQPAGAP